MDVPHFRQTDEIIQYILLARLYLWRVDPV
jgi:hypothetical protein